MPVFRPPSNRVQPDDWRRQVRRSIAWVLAAKVLVLVVFSQVFFNRDQHIEVDTATLLERLAVPPSTKEPPGD